MPRLSCAFALSGVLVAPSLFAQPAPVRLGPATAELPDPLSSVAGLRELSDGRVIVLDTRERTVWLTDAAFRSASKVGREGNGPGEYTRPAALAALPGDTTWIADGMSRRTLVLTPNGKFAKDESSVEIRPSEGVTYTVTPRGTDAQGRLYMALPLGLIHRGPDDKGETPIVRYDRRTMRFDTVATFVDPTRVRPATTTPQPVPGSGGGVRLGASGGGVGYAGKDDWSVAPDGAVAVVRAAPYRVDWVLPNGTRRDGKPVTYEKVRVRDAEKEELLDELRSRGGGTITTTGADGRSQTRTIPPSAPQTWADVKPPFVANTAIAAPNGTLWVQRSATATQKEVTWDLFDRSGTITMQVLLPRRARVVGFGKTAVYVARYDDDDLIHLARYAMPR
jgi:hypothetical protein